MKTIKKLIYPLLLGTLAVGIISFIALGIKRAIEWISIIVKIVIPSINIEAINPVLLLILTLIFILGIGIIIDKLLKKTLSSLMQQLLDKCPPVITDDGYFALKTGEHVNPKDGKTYATCFEVFIHIIPSLLGGLFRIIDKRKLKKFVIAPMDLITLTMAAGLIKLEKFELENFEKHSETQSLDQFSDHLQDPSPCPTKYKKYGEDEHEI